MKKVLLLLIMFCLIGPRFAYSGSNALDKSTREFGYLSLKQAIIYSLDMHLGGYPEDAIANPNGLIALLGLTDSNEARELLLELVEVNISEIHGKALTYAILKQGSAIRYELKSLMDKPIECALIKKGAHSKTINKIRCITKKTRNRRIKFYLEMIDKGETTELVF